MPTRPLVSTLVLAIASAAAAQPDLRIGAPAPDLDIEHWVQTPAGVTEIDPGDGNVYVLDFWATWCAPCIAGFPAISELQERHQPDDVIVVAVSDEPRDTVVNFMDKDDGAQRERMRFTVATDPDQSTRKELLEAASRYSLPQTIIIGRTGEIEWVGHPKLDDVDAALEAYLAGTLDRDAWRATFEKRLASETSLADLVEAKRWEDAAAKAAGNPEDLTKIAFAIVLTKDEAERDIALAERLAEQALDATGGEFSFTWHTLAAIRADQGRPDEAVRLQKKAIEAEPEDGSWAGYYKATLKRYEEAASRADG